MFNYHYWRRGIVRLGILVIAVFFITACDNNDGNDNQDDDTFTADPELTGNAVTYDLFTGDSDFGYSGVITFEERVDGFTRVTIDLDGPTGSTSFPAHLHYNAFDIEADLAALLNPVNAETGTGVTELTSLANESPLTYQDLLQFDGHIKVHLDDGSAQDRILVFGNIGVNRELPINGRIAPCESK